MRKLLMFMLFLSLNFLKAQSVPNFQQNQTYLYEPPLGMNVIYAHQNYSGSKGNGIKIIDIESGWNLDHKDVDDNVGHYGSIGTGDHGTAVMGILVGEENGWGITGIVPLAKAYAVKGNANDISSAISTAIASLDAGDVLLIEVQVDIIYNETHYLVPAEYYDYNRQKIKEAINKGITVIEIAGNSNFNLDLLEEFTTDEYSPYFTGAIIVGASNESHTGRWEYSNYGSRVDAHGIGENVVSTGYGDLYNDQGEDYYYTEDFGGTSASGPMVAGVAASLQGIYKAYFGSYISPKQIRNYIRYGGIWISGIGSYPDMKKLIARLDIPVDLIIYQKIKNENNQENTINVTIGHYVIESWDNKNQTPWNTTFYCEHDEILNAYQEVYTEDNINYYKYHDWNNDLTDVKNYNTFHIDSKTDKLTAYFKRIEEVSIYGKEIYNDSYMGKVYLKDPWYIYADELAGVKRNLGVNAEYFGGTCSLEVKIDGEFKGVFLEQGWPDWQPPYYSVKAEAQQTLSAHNQDITGYFLGWEGTDVTFQHADQQETPLVFHEANAEAKAVYKGHLASSVARATGYNNGRRMAKDGTGKLHLVYEDNGAIWYAYSSDNGQTWSKEERISAKKYTDSHGIEHSYIHPSIAAENDGSVYVTYECQLKKGSTVDTYILFRKKDNNWSNILTVSKGYYNSYGWWSDYQDHDDTYPTVTAGPSGIFVAYQSVTDDYHHYKSIKLRQYLSGEWSVESKLSSADGKPVIGNLSGTYKIALIWPHNGRIKYRAAYTYYNDEKDAWDWHWASEFDLSNFCPGLFDEHSQPSVAIDANNHGYMAWLAVDQEMDEQNVLYQKFNFGASPSSASSVYSLDFNEDYLIECPSVSYDASNGRVTVYYQYHNSIYRKYLSGSSWYYHNYGDGNFPNICVHSSVGAVWTKYTSAPYLLQSENLQNHLNKTSLAEVEAFKRFYFKSDSGYFAFDLKDVTLDDQTLTIHDDLHSDTVKVDVPVRFDYRIDLKSKAQAGPFLNFYFVSGDQKYLLDQFELSGDESESVIERSVTFDPGRAMQGYVHIVFAQEKPFMVNVVPDNATGLAKASSGAGWQAFVPEHFQLKQNFPNPFNPSTQIVFDLPQEAQITLQVFDINGHKVATLAKGLKAAGRYHVVFDAHNLASGVYIYRLSTDKGFVQSKKMMLIR